MIILVKFKSYFIIALGLLLIATLGTIFYPHTYSLLELLISKLGVPIFLSSGVRYVTLGALILLILSIVLLALSLRKYKVRAVFLAFIIFGAPTFIITVHQQFFASGIYSLQFQNLQSDCTIEKKVSNTSQELVCELVFLSQQKKPVQFELEFVQLVKDETLDIEYLNQDAPYELTINEKGKHSMQIRTRLKVDKSELANLEKMLKDETFELSVRIHDENGERYL